MEIQHNTQSSFCTQSFLSGSSWCRTPGSGCSASIWFAGELTLPLVTWGSRVLCLLLSRPSSPPPLPLLYSSSASLRNISAVQSAAPWSQQSRLMDSRKVEERIESVKGRLSVVCVSSLLPRRRSVRDPRHDGGRVLSEGEAASQPVHLVVPGPQHGRGPGGQHQRSRRRHRLGPQLDSARHPADERHVHVLAQRLRRHRPHPLR